MKKWGWGTQQFFITKIDPKGVMSIAQLSFNIDTDYNRQLILKYLLQLYGEEKTKQILKKNKSIDSIYGKGGIAWGLGKRSIEFFCLFYLQDTFVPKPNNTARTLAPIHYDIWQELQQMFVEDEFDKLAIAINRGCAKTTVLNFALSVWAHCYKISIYTLVCGKTEQDAIEFIAQTRQAFEENEYIKYTFGNLIDSRNYTVNKLELELANKTKIQAISSVSSPRGKKYNNVRPSIIIADDYQGKSDIITEEAREKKYRMWIEDSNYAGDKAVYRDGKKIKTATKFIVIGTIMHRDCFMSRILRNPNYKSIIKRVVEFDVDDYFNSGLWEEFKRIYFNNSLPDSKAYAKEFYYQHEADMKYKTIWPDKYNCLDLAIDYYEDPTAFKLEMMNDASKIGEKWFKSNRTMPKEQVEDNNFLKTMLCIDCAGVKNVNKSKSDYFALVVGSLADNDFKYIRYGQLLKFNEFDEYINHVIKLLKDFLQITHVYIEKNTYNGLDVDQIKQAIEKDKDLSDRNIEFINEMQRQNKDQKISTIVSDVDNGRIIFCAERVSQEFINQIMDFQGQNYSLHDDAPDIVAEFSNRINEIEIIYKLEFLDKRKLF